MFEDRREEIDALKDMMILWGFERHGLKTKTGELVLVKKMKVYNVKKDPKYNYPNIKSDVSYGILPIDYQYHTDLFPDLILRNENIRLFEEKPCGYAIEKTYICKPRYIPLKPGDLMVVYRMSERLFKKYYSVVTGICVLQQVTVYDEYKAFLKACKNTTVFKAQTLYELFNNKGYKTVIKVLFLKPLNKKIILNDLLIHGIINEDKGPSITTTITKEKFAELLQIGGVD